MTVAHLYVVQLSCTANNYFDSCYKWQQLAKYQILDDSTQIVNIIHGESSCMSLTFWNPILMRLCILFQANVINPKITDSQDISKSLWMIYGHTCTYKSKVITIQVLWWCTVIHRVLISWYIYIYILVFVSFNNLN